MSTSMSPQSFTQTSPAICAPRDHSGKGPWSSKAVKLKLVPAGSIMTPCGIFLKIASPTTPAETEKHEKWLLVGMFLVLSFVPGQEVLQHTRSNICMIVDLAVYVYIYVKCIYIIYIYIYIYLYKRSKPEKNPESASQRLIAAWWWRFPCVSEYQSNNPF